MARQRDHRVRVAAMAGVVLSLALGCALPDPRSAPVGTPAGQPATPAASEACPVTRPGGVPLPADVRAAVGRNLIFGAGPQGEGLYGRPEGALWVGGLPDGGRLGETPGRWGRATP